MAYNALFSFIFVALGIFSFITFLRKKQWRAVRWWLFGASIVFILAAIAGLALYNSTIGSFIEKYTSNIFSVIVICFFLFIILFSLIFIIAVMPRGRAMKRLAQKYNLQYRKKDDKGNRHILEGSIGNTKVVVYDLTREVPFGGLGPGKISEKTTIVAVNDEPKEYQGKITGYYPIKKLDAILGGMPH